MPDLLTHVSAAYLLESTFHKRFSGYRSAGRVYPVAPFYVGTILPDVFSRGLVILSSSAEWYEGPLHAPLVLVLECILLSYFFEVPLRKKVFRGLLSGVFLHLLLDSFQKTVGGNGYLWFFPFSWKSFNFGIFWPDDSIYAAPFLAFFIVVIKVIKYTKGSLSGK